MNFNTNIDSPLEIKLSFEKLVNEYQSQLESSNQKVVDRAKQVIELANNNPVLIDGVTDFETLENYQDEIENLLFDIFNPLLTNNEIKTAQIPFINHIIKSTTRFDNIINRLENKDELKVVNMPENEWYIIACSIILKACYGHDLNFKRPFFYEIPDENGVLRYYKILYNADFMNVVPKENAPEITKEDFNKLIDSFENIDLWREKFPPNSYEFKGFLVSNIFDVTDDQSISNIKTTLIGNDKRKRESFMDNFQEIFRSLFGLKDIQVGFTIYNKDEDSFEPVIGVRMQSFLLNDKNSQSCDQALCSWSYKKLLLDNSYFSISNVEGIYKKYDDAPAHIKTLHQQGIKSAIFTPIANEEGLLGVLEIVSKIPQQLNSINANKLVDVMPFIISAVERSKAEEENLIEAIIQKECTSIHPSVHWRFEQEAKNYIKQQYLDNTDPNFKQISFENVYPLYGQIDIKGSSEARNNATKNDLSLQLNKIKEIVSKANSDQTLPIYEQYIFQIDKFLNQLESNFQVDSEHTINFFIKNDMHPVLKHLQKQKVYKSLVDRYFDRIDLKINSLYHHRKQYDDTITIVNQNLAMRLDEKQEEAQKMYPHYFERFKTDGVEHNLYVGESLTKDINFNHLYLYNLRLWQLQVMCEMENDFYHLQQKLPVKLDVASMILVFNQPLSISFRMDEKQFDVDGTYNARYEIVKKRVDKAYIKGTTERVTQKGKISIVYSQKADEQEYLRYIAFLQSMNYLDDDVEIVELQDLQAVTGLKAIRVSVLYHQKKNKDTFYTYDDLMKVIG